MTYFFEGTEFFVLVVVVVVVVVVLPVVSLEARPSRPLPKRVGAAGPQAGRVPGGGASPFPPAEQRSPPLGRGSERNARLRVRVYKKSRARARARSLRVRNNFLLLTAGGVERGRVIVAHISGRTGALRIGQPVRVVQRLRRRRLGVLAGSF